MRESQWRFLETLKFDIKYKSTGFIVLKIMNVYCVTDNAKVNQNADIFGLRVLKKLYLRF